MPEEQVREDEVPKGVSVTALWVAQARADENARPDRLFEDPLDEAFVAAAGPTTLPQFDDLFKEIYPYMGDHVSLRTRFFDDYLLEACNAGCRQVAVLAAGVDTRAFRLAWPEGVRLFELDFPEVFAFKEQVLACQGAWPACHRIIVEADLGEEWATPLIQAGFRPDEPTAWLAEGILPYLTEEENDQLLTRVTRQSASGSQLAFEHMNRSAQELPPLRQAADALAELKASWESVLEDPESWLARYGWVGEVTDSASLAPSYDRPVPPFAELTEEDVRAWLVRAVREPARRQGLLERLRDPQPEDTTLPAEADGYLRLNPEDAEVREARERLPELDQSE